MTAREIAFQNSLDRLKKQASMAAVPARYQNVANTGQFQNTAQYANFQNAAGYTVAIDTLTAIRKSIVSQKFYQLNGKVISDYMPVAAPVEDHEITNRMEASGARVVGRILSDMEWEDDEAEER